MKPALKKTARYIFLSGFGITVLFYLLACLVPYLNSGSHWFIALLGLCFPILLVLLLGFIIYWAIRKSKWVWVGIAALALGLQQLSVTFSFHISKDFKPAKAPATLRVLTWNLSSWGESNRANRQNNKFDMVDLIKNSNADVLCFQEFLYYRKKQYLDTIIPELKAAGYNYACFGKVNYSGRLYTTSVLTGVEIMSKYPITDSAKIYYNDKDFMEPMIYADIQVNNQTIRFFTTHLQSVSFGENDYTALYKLKDPAEASVSGSRAVMGKLRYAYGKRTKQVNMLQEKIKESPHPVILCGDFNDVPNSYTYFTAKGNLQDAFLKKGSGIGRTFRFISPTLRIDYILADKKFDVLQYNTFKVPYSDHYPVVADFNINPK
ncbi:MAG: endonuclease/exonuclease/phosphatase family protein [Bacteroidetes bacterium]|nr:endonuclease/exonuclease/phosphatase family protein [Bacteroidota bacterium]